MSASSAFVVMSLLAGLGLLNLYAGDQEWMGWLVEQVVMWPLWELMALIISPVLMWWLDSADNVPLNYRILITGGLFMIWYLILSPSNHLLLAYIAMYVFARLAPMFLLPKPTAHDRKKELIKLSVIILVVLFVLMPCYIVFSNISRNIGIDLEENEDAVFLFVSSIYFFVVACIDLKLNSYRSVS